MKTLMKLSLLERIYQKLSYTSLVEKLFFRRKLFLAIDSHRLSETLFYLKVYPNSDQIKNWKDDIYFYITAFENMRLYKHKKPDVSFYFDHLYNDRYEDYFEEFFPHLYNGFFHSTETIPEIKLDEIDVKKLDFELQKFYMNLSVLCTNYNGIKYETIIEMIDN